MSTLSEIKHKTRLAIAAIREYDTSAQKLYDRRISSTPCGVYFLFSGHEIIYIGQSINVCSRVAGPGGGHSRTKNFDHFAFIECPQEYLGCLEAHFIMKFRPRLNKSIPPNPVYKSTHLLAELFALEEWEIEVLVEKYNLLAQPTGIVRYNVLDVINALESEK